MAIDLDPNRGDVDRDADLVTLRVRAAGGHLIGDRGPTGGRHLYLLLADPVPVDEVLRVLTGWQADCPSLDPAPMRSAHAGLIAPPGAVHKSGSGHRELTTSWPDIQALLDRPNPPTVWARLLTAAPQTAPRIPTQTGTTQDLAEAVDPLTRGMADKFVTIAQTGDSSAYPSPSEARQAVMWSAAAAGLSLTDVTRRLETGAWPGLAALYRRFAHSKKQHHQALTREWRKATTLVEKQRAEPTPQGSDRESNTRGPATHPRPRPAGHRGIRDWDNVLAHVEQHHLATEPTKVLILRAMGQAAQRRGEPVVFDGVRAISLATHLDISTVSRGLIELRNSPIPLIVRTEEHKGAEADTYELIIPESLKDLARQRWRRGPLRALHPVFRELGRVAGFVYEALARANTPLQVLELLEHVPYTKSAIDEALATLATYHLATATRDRRRTRWQTGPASLNAIAELIGADILHRAIVQRYRAERDQFHAILADWRARRLSGRLCEPPDPDPPPEPDPPSPAELLVAILGATCIEQPH